MADRDVRVNLKLEASGAGPKALKDCAAAADTASKHTSQFERDLKRLDGGRAASVGKAYADVAREADRATQSAKALNAETAKMRGGVATSANLGPRPGPAGGVPSAGATGGGLFSEQNTELLAQAGGVAAAMQTLSKGISVAATAVDALGNSSLSANQAIRKVTEAIPIFGELAKATNQLADAITGRTEEIRKTQKEAAVNQVKAQTGVSLFQQQSPLFEQMKQLEARDRIDKATPFTGFNAPSRDTMMGEVDYARYERRQPLLSQQRQAGISQAVAQEGEVAASQRRAEIQAQAERADRELAEARARAQRLKDSQDSGFLGSEGGPRRRSVAASTLPGDKTQFNGIGQAIADTGIFSFLQKMTPDQRSGTQGSIDSSQQEKDRLTALADIDAKLKEQIKLKQQLTTAQQQEGAAIKAAAEAESKYRQANIALLKDELQTLKEREQAISGQATSFGGLDASQRFSAQQAAQQFKERGFESLTADQRAAISAAGGGQALAFAQKQSALNDPAFQQFFANLGLETDLKSIRERQNQLNADVALSIELDEQALTDKLKKSFEPVLKAIAQSFQEIADATIAQVQLSQDLANAVIQ